jgi:hypothetical protein
LGSDGNDSRHGATLMNNDAFHKNFTESSGMFMDFEYNSGKEA